MVPVNQPTMPKASMRPLIKVSGKVAAYLIYAYAIKGFNEAADQSQRKGSRPVERG